MKSFKESMVLLCLFFIATPIVLVTSLFSLVNLISISKPPTEKPTIISQQPNGLKVFASLPQTPPLVWDEALGSDGRIQLIRNYLQTYHSPLASYADFLVQMADKYNLDYRLLTAIAQQESNLCKVIPENTYNCWGWGIHSKGTLGFASFNESIETVSKGLREEYLDKGYQTPEAIMSKYTPASPGSWAKGVSQFMAEIEGE